MPFNLNHTPMENLVESTEIDVGSLQGADRDAYVADLLSYNTRRLHVHILNGEVAVEHVVSVLEPELREWFHRDGCVVGIAADGLNRNDAMLSAARALDLRAEFFELVRSKCGGLAASNWPLDWAPARIAVDINRLAIGACQVAMMGRLPEFGTTPFYVVDDLLQKPIRLIVFVAGELVATPGSLLGDDRRCSALCKLILTWMDDALSAASTLADFDARTASELGLVGSVMQTAMHVGNTVCAAGDPAGDSLRAFAENPDELSSSVRSAKAFTDRFVNLLTQFDSAGASLLDGAELLMIGLVWGFGSENREQSFFSAMSRFLSSLRENRIDLSTRLKRFEFALKLLGHSHKPFTGAVRQALRQSDKLNRLEELRVRDNAAFRRRILTAIRESRGDLAKAATRLGSCGIDRLNSWIQSDEALREEVDAMRTTSIGGQTRARSAGAGRARTTRTRPK
jgi:hypothetical protein